jgi:hypothetical protein
MKLADCVAQLRRPFIVQDATDQRLTYLSNAADYADVVSKCPLRYVLSDDLTRLCADLAYSKGAQAVSCVDLLHVPAETLWIEWCNTPWRQALERYGFPLVDDACQWIGRRGVLIRATRDGRRGLIRTFWNVNDDQDALASSMEACFDFDTTGDESPEFPERGSTRSGRVQDKTRTDDILGRCFRFRYEASWANYYERSLLCASQSAAIWQTALGTIAMDVPMLIAFLLLMATRTGLPQRTQSYERLNRQRLRTGRPALLDHIELRAPLLPEYRTSTAASESNEWRRRPRLHYVRGHLVRRGSQIFWRVPHLRGRARSGTVQSRTVIWTFDEESTRSRDVGSR